MANTKAETIQSILAAEKGGGGFWVAFGGSDYRAAKEHRDWPWVQRDGMLCRGVEGKPERAIEWFAATFDMGRRGGDPTDFQLLRVVPDPLKGSGSGARNSALRYWVLSEEPVQVAFGEHTEVVMAFIHRLNEVRIHGVIGSRPEVALDELSESLREVGLASESALDDAEHRLSVTVMDRKETLKGQAVGALLSWILKDILREGSAPKTRLIAPLAHHILAASLLSSELHPVLDNIAACIEHGWVPTTWLAATDQLEGPTLAHRDLIPKLTGSGATSGWTRRLRLPVLSRRGSPEDSMRKLVSEDLLSAEEIQSLTVESGVSGIQDEPAEILPALLDAVTDTLMSLVCDVGLSFSQTLRGVKVEVASASESGDRATFAPVSSSGRHSFTSVSRNGVDLRDLHRLPTDEKVEIINSAASELPIVLATVKAFVTKEVQRLQSSDQTMRQALAAAPDGVTR